MGSRTVESAKMVWIPLSANWLESVTLVDLPDEVSTEEIPNLLPRLNTVWLGRKLKTEFLGRLDNLKVLWIRYGQADGLPNLPQLETLIIDGDDGTVIDCDLLPDRFPNLAALMIRTEVENIDALMEFTRLRTLTLGSYGKGPSVVDVAPIGELATLKWLFIGCDEIIDLSPLARLSNLESLELKWNDRVNPPPELKPLHALGKLQQLKFNNSCYTHQQLRELRDHLPDECPVYVKSRRIVP